MNFSISFHYFGISVTVSYDVKKPQMNFGKPQILSKIKIFSKIIKNQQMNLVISKT